MPSARLLLTTGVLASALAGAVTPCAGTQALAQTRAPVGWTAFTAALDAYAGEDGVVGGRATLLRNGRVLADHAYGLGDRERGRLTLDDPIIRYVPELRQVHDAFGSMDDVTLRMLLSHSAGFQNPTWPYGSGRSWEPFEPTRWEQPVALVAP